MPKLPFSMGVTQYDDPPPDRIISMETMHRADMFRAANELKGWIDVEDGKIVDHGHVGGGRIGFRRLRIRPKEITVAAVALPTMQKIEAGDGFVRFTQTAGGRSGVPTPRTVYGKPYFQITSAIAWTTLTLTINADGSSEHELAGASPFPRHWIYDKDGKLVQKSAAIDFDKWYREAHEQNTPWGMEDSPAVVTAVETALERELSLEIMGGGRKAKPQQLAMGERLVEQGDSAGDTNLVFLVLDGVLEVVVDSEVIAELGPGAIAGERAQLEGGRRTATLRAKTTAKVVPAPAEELDRGALEGVAAGHRREES